MKAKEFLREYTDYRTENVNVSVTIEPTYGRLSQNINNINYRNDDVEPIYSKLHTLKKSGLPDETINALLEQLKGVRKTATDTASKLLLELTDAYYVTAYAIVAQAVEKLVQDENAVVAQAERGISAAE